MDNTTRKIDDLLMQYGESHQNKLNKNIHWVCVPIIFFSIVGLVWSIPNSLLQLITPHPFANWATLTLIIVLMYYLWLSPSLFFGMTLFSILCLFLAHYISVFVPLPFWAVSLSLFILAWIGQFYGHKVEGKKPSFLKDIQFLLIGPAWLMHFIYKKWNIKY